LKRCVDLLYPFILGIKDDMIKSFLTLSIALIWPINGLFCKVLLWVPRHQEIVGAILGDEYGFVITKIIGFLEILMSVWILSGIQSKWCAILQILLIGTMNIIEINVAPELLLFGKANIFPALVLMAFIYVNAFILIKQRIDTPITTNVIH